MKIEIGDKVYFIGAEPVTCSSCDQDTANLIYRPIRGTVGLVDEVHTPIWQRDPCNCGTQCGCTSKPNYDKPPEIRSIRGYTVILSETESYGPMPESAIYTSEEETAMAIDSKKIRSVVLIRRPTNMMTRQVGDILRDVPGEASER
jgi:hypothetical protein